MLAQQPAVLQKQIWIAPDDDGQRRLPVEAEEMRRALKKWRTVSDVARAFAGWYNGNDVRRFVSYLAHQYRQDELLPRTDIERHFAWMKRYFGLKYFQCFTLLRVTQFVLLTYCTAGSRTGC
jgi:hypothetical protein